MSLSLGLALLAFAISCAIAWLLHRISNPKPSDHTRPEHF